VRHALRGSEPAGLDLGRARAADLRVEGRGLRPKTQAFEAAERGFARGREEKPERFYERPPRRERRERRPSRSEVLPYVSDGTRQANLDALEGRGPPRSPVRRGVRPHHRPDNQSIVDEPGAWPEPPRRRDDWGGRSPRGWDRGGDRSPHRDRLFPPRTPGF